MLEGGGIERGMMRLRENDYKEYLRVFIDGYGCEVCNGGGWGV